MKRLKQLWIAVLAAGALAAPAAQADIVRSISGTTIGFDGLVVLPSAPNGPVNAGSGVTVSSVGGGLSLGEAPFPGAWDLGTNGFWSLGKTFAGVNGGVDPLAGAASLRFDFATPQAQVGGFMNFDPGFETFGIPELLSFAAYDAGGNELESWFLPLDAIVTPPAPDDINFGQFYGIGRLSADIASFVVFGPYAVIDDLTFTTTPIPEPSTYAMLLAGLGLLGFMARRRRAG
jgi:hypothetical protein